MDETTATILIPAYNEEERLPPYLKELIDALPSMPIPTRLLVIDDGSSDRTSVIAEELLTKAQVHRLPINRGKGAAIQEGIGLIRTDIAIMADADGAYGPDVIRTLMEHYLKERPAVVIAARKAKGGSTLYRRILSRIFNLLVRTFLKLPFHDTQAGMKLFDLKHVRPVIEALEIKRFGFDIELLFLASRAGLRIDAVPVENRKTAGSKMMLKDSIGLLFDIMSVRLRYGLR